MTFTRASDGVHGRRALSRSVKKKMAPLLRVENIIYMRQFGGGKPAFGGKLVFPLLAVFQFFINSRFEFYAKDSRFTTHEIKKENQLWEMIGGFISCGMLYQFTTHLLLDRIYIQFK